MFKAPDGHLLVYLEAHRCALNRNKFLGKDQCHQKFLGIDVQLHPGQKQVTLNMKASR